MKIEIQQRGNKHLVIVHHEEGQGYGSRLDTTTVIASFPSKRAAEMAFEKLRWWGYVRFNDGRHAERRNRSKGS